MLFTRAIAIACLTVFAWLLWVTTCLFLLLVAMAWWSGDPALKLGYLTLMAIGTLVGGFVCRLIARRIEHGPRG